MKRFEASTCESSSRPILFLAVLVAATILGMASQFSLLQSYMDSVWLSTTIRSVDSTSLSPSRKWAYVYLIGGCQQENPNYRGFLYNVMASKHRLQQLGSQADVVLMIQMSVHTNETTLPNHEVELLNAMDIKLRYLPKYAAPAHENFYALMLEKFRILQLTEYSRAMYLDGDVLPECNLDYLFDLSEPEMGEPLLKENVLIGYKNEPSHGGIFMYQPDMSDYERLQLVIRAKERKALHLPYPHWDAVEGWGHKIEAPDEWRSPSGKSGTNWTWHGSFADQGLLYHWSKYVKQRVSLIIGDEIENWSSRNGSAYLEEVIQDSPLSNCSCLNEIADDAAPPVSDIRHFTGSKKPWEPENYAQYNNYLRQTDVVLVEGSRYSHVIEWYKTLESIAALYNAKFDFSHLEIDEPGGPMGRFPVYNQMILHIHNKAKRGWNAYELNAATSS
eukprot:Nitzschia sp. Nitz4//scaffold7_size249615//43974//45487//NITZ4_001148-RA/size249615-augustus-gene-0.1-mRNA-1//1//CDS//3329558355//3005//frame0